MATYVTRSMRLLLPRLTQAVFATVVIGLSGHMLSTSYWNAIPRQGGNAAPVNFSMFLGAWVLFLSPFYIWSCNRLTPSTPQMDGLAEERERREKERQTLVGVLMALDGLNLILLFSGAVAMSAGLGVHSCSNDDYTSSNGITNSSPNTKVRCREAQATTAFLWFEVITFVWTILMTDRLVFIRQYPDKLGRQSTSVPADRVPRRMATDLEMRGAEAPSLPVEDYRIGRAGLGDDHGSSAFIVDSGDVDEVEFSRPPPPKYVGGSDLDGTRASGKIPGDSSFAALGRRMLAAINGEKRNGGREEWE